MEDTSLKQAVEKLCNELRTDSELYQTYQANIAIQFYDEMSGHGIGDNLEIHKSELNEACNNAAKRFLDLLIKK